MVQKRLRIDLLLNVQSFSESDLFNIKIMMEKGKFFLQRDRFFGSVREAFPEKIRKRRRHRPCKFSIRRRQCTDGIETIEQKMRIDLHAQSLQF